jgi:hypothetical protein
MGHKHSKPSPEPELISITATTHTLDQAAAEAYVQDHMPAILDAIQKQIEDGTATWTSSTNGIETTKVTVGNETNQNVSVVISNFHNEAHSKVKRGLDNNLANVFKIQGRGIGVEGGSVKRADERLHVAAPFFTVFGVVLVGVVIYILHGKAKANLAKRKKDKLFARLVKKSQESYMGV